jgi:hypothetical protein
MIREWVLLLKVKTEFSLQRIEELPSNEFRSLFSVIIIVCLLSSY